VRTLRWWLSEFGDALGVHDQSRLEYLEVVHLEVVDQEGGTTGAETVYNGQLMIVGM